MPVRFNPPTRVSGVGWSAEEPPPPDDFPTRYVALFGRTISTADSSNESVTAGGALSGSRSGSGPGDSDYQLMDGPVAIEHDDDPLAFTFALSASNSGSGTATARIDLILMSTPETTYAAASAAGVSEKDLGASTNEANPISKTGVGSAGYSSISLAFD